MKTEFMECVVSALQSIYAEHPRFTWHPDVQSTKLHVGPELLATTQAVLLPAVTVTDVALSKIPVSLGDMSVHPLTYRQEDQGLAERVHTGYEKQIVLNYGMSLTCFSARLTECELLADSLAELVMVMEELQTRGIDVDSVSYPPLGTLADEGETIFAATLQVGGHVIYRSTVVPVPAAERPLLDVRMNYSVSTRPDRPPEHPSRRFQDADVRVLFPHPKKLYSV